MVVNEKGLLRAMKEAYKTYGYTVAVKDGKMMLTNGFWLAYIDEKNVPSELLGMLAEHIRDVPKEGCAFRVYKTKEGPFVQSMLLEDAIKHIETMEKEKEQNEKNNPISMMRRTGLTLDGLQVWQERPGNTIYVIDPRYAVMFDAPSEIVRLGNGIYAEGEISELWVLRCADGSAVEKVQHLEQIAWVE